MDFKFEKYSKKNLGYLNYNFHQYIYFYNICVVLKIGLPKEKHEQMFLWESPYYPFFHHVFSASF